MKINGAVKTITPQAPANVKGGTQISKDANGSYTINLSDKNNKVDVSQNKDGSWQVAIDGRTKLTLSKTEMENLTINGNGGDDTVNVKNGVLSKPLTINGGKGSDTVKLGFDKANRTFVDKANVKFQPGTHLGDKDTFEYTAKAKVTAREGEALPSSTFVTRTEVSQ